MDITHPSTLLVMIWGGLCPHHVSTYWHCITLNMTYCILRANPNKRWAQKGRVDYLWNKAIWGKPLKGRINMGTVSSYVNDLRQIVKRSKINLCHGPGGVSWCFSGKKPKPWTTRLKRKRNTHCSFDIQDKVSFCAYKSRVWSGTGSLLQQRLNHGRHTLESDVLCVH